MASFQDHIPVQASSSAHHDPIKEFVECLYVNYDFDLAQQKLLECEKVRGGRQLGSSLGSIQTHQSLKLVHVVHI